MPNPQLLLPEDAPADARSVDELIDAYAPREKRSVVESTVRAAAQGLTANFADEITGSLEAAFTHKTYRQARDESRAAYAEAKKDNPTAYAAGEIAGGLAGVLLPGGELVKGAGLAANVARGALYGAANAAGESETEATERPGQLLEEAGQGAAGGAIAGGVGHAVTKGLAAILAPVRKVAGRVFEGAGREADAYATERLAAAQGKGEEAFTKEAEKFAPLLEKEPANRQAAAAGGEAATSAADKHLTDSAWERLLKETGNVNRVKAIGKSGANEAKMKAVLAEDRELRAAIDVGGEPGVAHAGALPAGKGPDAALDILGKKIEAEGERSAAIYEAAQGATPGAKPAESRLTFKAGEPDDYGFVHIEAHRKADGAKVGDMSVFVTPEAGKVAHVTDVKIDDKLQRQGYGRELYEYADSLAHDRFKMRLGSAQEAADSNSLSSGFWKKLANEGRAETRKDGGWVMKPPAAAAAAPAEQGVRLPAVLGGLKELEQQYRRLSSTRALADSVKAEIDGVRKAYKGQKAVPFAQARQEATNWQKAGYNADPRNPIAAQKLLQQDIANVWRGALHGEIESLANKDPALKTLLPDLEASNQRMSGLMSLNRLLVDWSTALHAKAPRMGEMLSPLRGIRAAVEKQGVELGRAALGNVAAAAARRGGAGAPSAAMARLMQAARAGALTTQAIREAAAAGIPPEVIERVKNLGGGGGAHP